MNYIKPKNHQFVKGLFAIMALISLILPSIATPAVAEAKEDVVCAYLSQTPSFLTATSGITTVQSDADDQASNAVGCLDLPPAPIIKKPYRSIKATITVYSSTPDQTDSTPFIAASGKRVHDGMIAANGLPFGTKVKIPSLYGDKVFVVEDRMNARYGLGHIDIWMDAPRAELMKFGVKRVNIEIYYPDALVAVK